MDILLSRIIRYLNGVITDDRQYRTALFTLQGLARINRESIDAQNML